jgi:hypothetical protein
MYNNNCVV